MGKYATLNEGPERLELVRGIFKIFYFYAQEFTENYVDDRQLEQLSVDITNFSLENGKSDVTLRSFFYPLNKDTFERLWSMVELDDSWPEWN